MVKLLHRVFITYHDNISLKYQQVERCCMKITLGISNDFCAMKQYPMLFIECTGVENDAHVLWWREINVSKLARHDGKEGM